MTTREYPTHKQCLVCGSADLRPMANYARQYLVQCNRCKFVFAERIPSMEELVAHYSTYGRNDYLSPITIKRYHEILDFLEPYRKTNKMIDVGCGIGHFLEIAQTRGWEVYGTEFTDEAIDICEAKGISMQKGVLDPGHYSPGSFDVVVSFEVIEHINNPNEELENFNAILRPGGAVYVTTPNFNSASRFYLKQEWSVIEYPEHLSYYTAASLGRVMKKHGFHKKWIRTTGISMSRFQSSKAIAKKKAAEKSGINVQVEKVDLVGKHSADEQLRSRLENNPLLKLAKAGMNTLLTITKKGDSMKGLFEKQ